MAASLGRRSFLTACGTAVSLAITPYVTSAAARRAAVVEMSVRADGTVILERKTYTDPSKLKLALLEIASRTPPPSLFFRAHRKTKYEAVSGPIALAQEAGLQITVMGFIE